MLVEVNAGWLAWTMHTVDEYYEAHAAIGWTKPKLAELPSHYIRRQIHATFQCDPIGLANLPITGPDCLLWGNDYPHPESTYPNSNKVLDDLLKNVSHADAVRRDERQCRSTIRVLQRHPHHRPLARTFH